MNRIDAYVEEAAAPSLVSEPTTVARGIGDRLIASISCASDSGIDTRRLKQLLLIGLALIALFEMAASAFPVLSGDSPKPDPIAFRTFILVLLSVSAISLPWIGRNWRWWTLSFCIILMLSATMLDKEKPAAGPENPAHLCNCGFGIWNGAQGPCGYDGVNAMVLDRDGLGGALDQLQRPRSIGCLVASHFEQLR